MRSKNFEYLDVIIDNPYSWMWNYIDRLIESLKENAVNVRIFKNADDIQTGDILFILSCNKILKQKDLDKHKHNIVIHASDLPRGRGWSPWTWEVENGANYLTLTLFEAVLELDAGNWYLKKKIDLDGTELIDSIRKALAFAEFELINEYLQNYPVKSIKQGCDVTFYNKRTSKNQELNINKSINEQFNLLRVCDNNNYPAYFYRNGKKYIVKIEEE